MSALVPSIQIPKLNPIKLYDIVAEQAFFNTIPNFFEQTCFEQIYQKADYLTFQIKCENAPAWGVTNTIVAGLYGIDGLLKYTVAVPLLYAGLVGYYYYEARYYLGNVTEGVYQLRINIKNKFGSFVRSEYDLYSEPIWVKTTHENSVLIKYTHKDNNMGMLFVYPVSLTQLYYQMRVFGGFLPTDLTPASKDIVYRDQEYDISRLSSIPYITQKFTLGNGAGVPNYIVEIFNRIISTSSFAIENIQYLKSDNAKLERNGEDNYALAGWKVELEVPDNVNITTYSDTPIQQATTIAVANHVIANIYNGYVMNGITMQTGQVFVLPQQTNPIDNGIYIVGATAGSTSRLPAYPTDASCDNVIIYTDFADSLGNYIFVLYYDTLTSTLMIAPITSFASNNKATVSITGTSKAVVFPYVMYSVPTMITLQAWDSLGQPVVVGYDPATVSVNGMTIVAQGNAETLTCTYEVEV